MIQQDVIQVIIGNGIRIARTMIIALKISRTKIKPGQAASECGYPYTLTVPVFRQGHYEVIRDGIRIGRLVFINIKTISVVPVQPVLGCDPQETVLVLNDMIDGALRQSFFQREPPETQIIVGLLGEQA